MRRPLFIFYFLLIYAMAELIWWGILLVQLHPERIGMIVGEGSVFLFVLCLGGYYLYRSLHKERDMYNQQNNFLLSVTHELKSPVASVKLYLQTMLKHELEHKKQQEFIRNALQDIERLDDLVENVLIATKIENRSYSFPKEDFNFSELVSGIVTRMHHNTRDRCRLVTGLQENVMLYGDRFALSLAVSNLIENAVKYSKNGCLVEIALKQEADQVRFSVKDNGVGIADREKDRIFRKFYRVGNEETRRTKGTGLGLFIVKQVLDNHAATIWVKDNEPRGTVFEVVFNPEE